MASPAPTDLPPRRRLPVAALCALALVAALTGVWLARDWAGERLAVEYLRRRGVPAQIHLTRLDARGVEGSVALGPPSTPTLVVPRFRAEFDPLSGLRAPRVSRLTLDRPVLNLAWDGRRLRLGALQPLVDEALRTPPAKGGPPPPAVQVSAGELRAATSYGPVRGVVDAETDAGGLRQASLRLAPTRLAGGLGEAEGVAGGATVRRGAGDRYDIELALTATRLRGAGGAAQGVGVEAHASLAGRADAADRPVSGAWRLQTATATAAGVSLLAPRFAGDLAGVARLGATPSFRGRASARIDATGATSPQGAAQAPHLQLAATDLSLTPERQDGRFAAGADAASGWASVAGERVAVTDLRATLRGRWRAIARAAPTLEARASVAATGGLAPERARALSRRWARGSFAEGFRPALEAGLTRSALAAPGLTIAFDGRSWRGATSAPVTLGNARARLAVAAPDGWSLSGRQVFDAPRLSLRLQGADAPAVALDARTVHGSRQGGSAGFALRASGSAGPLRDAALSAEGSVAADGSGARLALSRCAHVQAGRYLGDAGTAVAEAVSGEVCPAAGAPALALSRDGDWRAALAARTLALRAPEAELAVADGEADVVLRAVRGRPAGDIRLRTVRLADIAAPTRFRPLALEGPLRLSGERLTGALDVALVHPAAKLGRATVEQDLAAGATRLAFVARALAFAPGALQPASVLPGLAPLGQDVEGAADVDFDLGLTDGRTTSFVHARTSGLQIRTTAGLAQGVSADVTLTDLDPLTSPPDQRVTAERVSGVAPLTGVEARFQLGGQALRLTSARADLAGGVVTLEPTRVGLQPGDGMEGAVRVDGVQLGVLLDALNLSKAVSADARLQGVLPFSFGKAGLRFSDGRLQATGPGRISLNRAAISGATTQGPTPAASPSAVQDFAYKALEDLAFTELNAAIASRPQGRLGVVFHIKGRHEPAVGESDRIDLLSLARGHAFDQRIPLPKGTEVNLTLDTSLNLDDLLAAYPGLSPTPGSAQVQPQDARPVGVKP